MLPASSSNGAAPTMAVLPLMPTDWPNWSPARGVGGGELVDLINTGSMRGVGRHA